MKQKKLMLLGGIRYLIPVIEAAHKLGAYVITADYLPDNIAHKYSDEYVNVSIIDREAVLHVAKARQIDGILSFGVDPGVITAAYVAEKLGLPSPPLKSVEILQNKDIFRKFLEENGFNCPKRYQTDDNINYPVIVKPVDSAGSKGCTRVNCFAELSNAIACAKAESHNGRIIIEQFLELAGHQTGSDCFSVNNELVFCSFDSQYFDSQAPNPYAPIAHIWPSDMPQDAQDKLSNELQRLIRLLNLGTSIYNVEARVAMDGKPYLMEVSPRGGGNRLAECLFHATGVNLIENCVRYAIGMPLTQNINLFANKRVMYNGVWVNYVIHSNNDGNFSGIEIDSAFSSKYVQDCVMYARDKIEKFTGANKAIGSLFMNFDNLTDAENAIRNNSWLKIKSF